MSVNLFWFRRDLRFHDNTALFHALQDGNPVLPIFIFDRNILDALDDKKDQRVQFIHQAILELNEVLTKQGSALQVFHGYPEDIFKRLLTQYKIEKVYCNEDYEQYAIERDHAIEKLVNENNATFHRFKDQVIFDKLEVVKDNGQPYTVFTPYSRKWKSRLNDYPVRILQTEKLFDHFFKQKSNLIPTVNQLGFIPTSDPFPDRTVSNPLLLRYHLTRDYPSLPGTSRISVHLRFGTVSIRELVIQAQITSEPFLNELIWRDFYQMILWNFPHISLGKSFKKEYDLIKWRNNESEFDAWCKGSTGYPIVDAGMRELNATGYMHNRVRMIVASFLCKHLLIDWRWGEAYFANKLLDFDFAANNGGWQWAAGSGCDAAPYFRIFNPSLQTKKFDPELKYIRKWVPEIDELNYPRPIVDHEFARKRCLEVYAIALKEK